MAGTGSSLAPAPLEHRHITVNPRLAGKPDRLAARCAAVAICAGRLSRHDVSAGMA